MNTSTGPRPRLALAAAAMLSVSALAVRWGKQDAEDFVYYYCAGFVRDRGGSPYDRLPYQKCIDAAYGAPNPNASLNAASAYPPTAMPAFGMLAAHPYRRAFLVWNLLLLSASLALVAFFPAVPEDGLLLCAWPGFVFCWIYHKMTVVLFLAAMAGVRAMESGWELSGGAALGALALQPQWLAAFLLRAAARRKTKTLVGALAAGAALAAWSWRTGGWGAWTAWAASAAAHASSFISYDNQSLYAGACKIIRASRAAPRAWMGAPLRAALTAAPLAAAWRPARERGELGLYLGLILIAQPYSHASDALWAFPLFLSLRADAARRFGWSRARSFAAAALALALAWTAILLPGAGRLGIENREGWLSAALVAAALALRRRRGKDFSPIFA